MSSTPLSPPVPRADFPRRALMLLALGTFAIGTEGFMIAPLLPAMAAELGVSVAIAGQLVTVFALVYGLSSPLLTAATAAWNRRTLLVTSMSVFLLGNLVAWQAGDYATLMAARVVMALAAGLFMPNANAVAGSLVAPARRGGALAIVAGGQSIAIALGVPLAAAAGNVLGWRDTFLGVAGLAALAIVGVMLALPRGHGAPVAVPTMAQRLQPLRQGGVLATLGVTVLWAVGAYAVLTYLAVYLAGTLDVHGATVSGFMFVWGVSAAAGVFVGGMASDRFGASRVIGPALGMLAAAFAGLTAIALAVPHAWALVPVLVCIAAWGLAVWGFFPPQQARLIALAGAPAAPVVLSLNASAMYLGFSAGAVLGAFVLAHGSYASLGAAGAAAELAALGVFLATRRPRGRAADTAPAP